jgi:pimeloyl-ACP methyl ester carboxylesterase
MKFVEAGVLNIAYLEVGPPDGMPVILLHGFPYDVHSYDTVSERLSGAGFRCIVPFLRGFGPTTFLSTNVPRSGQQAALGADLLALMDALNIQSAVLGGFDWGGRAACIVSALWPERVLGLVSCGTGYNIQNIPEAGNPAAPEEEHCYWYQYYFHSERGRMGLANNRNGLCQLLWRLWSPTWKFEEITFDQSAKYFENPDFVNIVIHSYRHRFDGLEGDPALADIEGKLAAQPIISTPCIVLQGADDGVEGLAQVRKNDALHFTGFYDRRIVSAVGHNFPQEAPDAFCDAIFTLGGLLGTFK